MRKKTHEEYVKELNLTNPNIEVLETYINTNTKILHKCKIDGHEWSAKPANLLHGEGCPICGRKSTTTKQRKTQFEYIKDVFDVNPNIEVIGEYINNKTKILHRCNICKYEWLASPGSILTNGGCPKCSKNLKKTHEEYVLSLKEINPNIEVVGEYINMKTSILHKCLIDGYEWYAKPLNTIRGKDCPVCSGNKIKQGYNDFATLYPSLLKEWSYELNKDLDPTSIPPSFNKKVWWTCLECGNNYKSKLSNRTYNSSGCPTCNASHKKSLCELRVYYYIKKYFPNAVSGYSDKINGIYELDIYIPSLKIGIEYDGEKWHQDIQRDKKKDGICKAIGISLIRIREKKCPVYDSNCIFLPINQHSQKDIRNAIIHLLTILGVENPDVNFSQDHNEIYSLAYYKRKENSITNTHPELLLEWDYTKNGNLTPENVSSGSSKYAWWKCKECGHEWFATINSRTSGCKCPICAKTKKNKI